MGIPCDSIDNPAHGQRIDVAELLRECDRALELALHADLFAHQVTWIRDLRQRTREAAKTFS
jgi:hypothetical protein